MEAAVQGALRTYASLGAELREVSLPHTDAVQVAKPGFARLEQKGIEVSAAKPARVELVLNVGKVQESLTISAEGNKPVGVPVAAGEPKRIRVGGSVQATKMEKMVQPKYPQEVQN